MNNYTGNKKIYGVYHKIINEIPPYKEYIEPFAGGGAIGLLLLSQKIKALYRLNDIDPAVVDRIDYKIMKTFPSTSAERSLQTKISTSDTGTEVEILLSTPAGKVILSTESVFDIMQTLSSARPGLADTFVFMDPPYHHSTRPNNTALYKYEFTDRDHLQLLSSARDLKCNCMIIHPKCDLYDRALPNWRQVPVKIRYHRKTSLECLYMNYERPKALQTDMYLGKDRTDRQRIKRKAERFVKKFSALDPLERKYVLDRINNPGARMHRD